MNQLNTPNPEKSIVLNANIPTIKNWQPIANNIAKLTLNTTSIGFITVLF